MDESKKGACASRLHSHSCRCIYEYIYIYVRIHKYVYICIHIHTNMYIHIYTYICKRTYIHIYTYIYIRMNAKVAEWRKRPIERSETPLDSAPVGHESCKRVKRYMSREVYRWFPHHIEEWPTNLRHELCYTNLCCTNYVDRSIETPHGKHIQRSRHHGKHMAHDQCVSTYVWVTKESRTILMHRSTLLGSILLIASVE